MIKTNKIVRLTTAFTLTASLVTSILLPTSNVEAATSTEMEVSNWTNEFIVQVRDGYDIKPILSNYKGEIIDELPLINGYILHLPLANEEYLKSEPGIARVSKAAAVESQGLQIGKENFYGKKSVKENTHRVLINAVNLKETGKGVGVAVLDSGINNIDYDKVKVTHSVAINPTATDTFDHFGHGTHVAGIIEGNDTELGVAPNADIINVKLGNDQGELTEVDLLLGLQWVFDNKETYNIKVVNLSVSSTVEQSYKESPLAAAVEQLWNSGVTVVTASGNSLIDTENVNFPPANDPSVITVGAVNGSGKVNPGEVELAPWSKNGSLEGYSKPELTAPGEDITSFVPTNANLQEKYPDSVEDKKYMTMSGTSMAAPVVTGAVALLLEANPSLTPNQVKFLLVETSGKTRTGEKIIDVKKAIDHAKDKKYMDNLNLTNYNQWQPSEFINPDENVMDYSKLAWRVHDYEWLKLAWRNCDWAKLAWRSYWVEIGEQISNSTSELNDEEGADEEEAD